MFEWGCSPFVIFLQVTKLFAPHVPLSGQNILPGLMLKYLFKYDGVTFGIVICHEEVKICVLQKGVEQEPFCPRGCYRILCVHDPPE